MIFRFSRLLPEEGIVRRFLLLGLASCFLALLGIGVAWRFLPPEVPLFYSNPWGKEQLAPPYLLLLPIFLAFLFWGINIFLANKVFAQYSFVKTLLFVGSGLAFLLSAITTLRIILLVV